jgi:SPP1 gp7 family putative phage head morphogenesis protein
MDPTRTYTIRRAFVADMTRRFRKIKRDIWTSIVTNDALGLKAPVTAQALPRKAFEFKTDRAKVKGFMDWLEDQVDQGIFELVPGERRRVTGEVEWASTYIDTAYKRGIRRGRDELKQAARGQTQFDFGDLEGVGREEFSVDAAFLRPIHADRVGAIYTRTYSDLVGITTDMEREMSAALAQGLADGKGPRTIARELMNRIEQAGGSLAIVDERGTVRMRALQRARILARTEVIRAHHVATINTYREAGVVGVKVKAEWSTAGDDRVCPDCADLNEQVFTLDEIEPMIPLHPQCRCVALPLVTGTTRKGG